ncbi:MAG TPA: DUF1761 domain-containing protein [Candidatus Saccharibacteria bacterium]|nr:DUF1761 domain-containing protein [Candidatus Saccharibacteria bacterium]
MSVEVNYWGVVVAMLSSMAVGSFWYAQAVFGKRWAKLANVDMSKDRGNMFKPIATTMVVSLITAYVLAHVAYLTNQFFGRSFLQDSLTTAFWLWLGFTAARFITHDAFEGRPSQLTLINAGNEFFTVMLMGLVIGLFGV